MSNLIKNGFVTALDIGSTKICCLIAKVLSDGSFHIIGSGYAQAKGIKNGVIVHLNDATASIQDAIMMAEEKAERRVESVIVNISSTQLKSTFAKAEIEIADNKPVSSNDVRKLIDLALQKAELSDQEIIHQLPLSYDLDGQNDITEPSGLYGKKLSIILHVISVPLSQIRNLTLALERCHVSIDAKVATPYASALAVLSEDEKETGATLIDIGGGNASMAIFSGGFIRYAAALPLGGLLLTKDIAQVLKTPLPDAERVKTLYGSAFLSPQDEKETLSVPLIGETEEGTLTTLPRSYLISIMVPRIEEMLELTNGYLKSQETDDYATRRIVLCGGCSLIPGLREKASAMLEAQVRLGKPLMIKGLPDFMPSTTFSTATGLLRYAANRRIHSEDKRIKPTTSSTNFIKRVTKWLMQNF